MPSSSVFSTRTQPRARQSSVVAGSSSRKPGRRGQKRRYVSLRARTRLPARASVGICPGQFFRKQVSLSILLTYRRFLSTRGRNRERTHSKRHLWEHTPSEAETASLGETGGRVGEAGSGDSSHGGGAKGRMICLAPSKPLPQTSLIGRERHRLRALPEANLRDANSGENNRYAKPFNSGNRLPEHKHGEEQTRWQLGRRHDGRHAGR